MKNYSEVVFSIYWSLFFPSFMERDLKEAEEEH